MAVKFTNNARTTLAADISNSATTATVTSGSVFPVLNAGEYFYCTFDNGTNNEIVKVTARSGNTLTIVRGVDNTTARAFSTDDAAELRATAGLLTDIQENIAAKSANQTVYNATTASSATDYDIGIDPGLESNAMVFLNGVMQHHDTFSFSGSTLTFDTAPSNGLALEVIVDNLINLQSSNLTVDTFTAADVGGNPQVDFVLSDAPAGETNLIVFVDGVFQANDTYTISSTTLSMTDGVTADMTVTVYVMNPVNIGAPSDNTVTSSKLSGNITMPADLTVTGDVAFDSPTFVVDNANSRVGLGTASPSVPVDIVGDVKMSANLTVDTTTLVVDSTNNRVGIGTASPSFPLDISGDRARIAGGTTTTFAGLEVENSNGFGTIFGTGGSGRSDLLDNRGFISAQSATSGLALGTEGADPIIFYTNGTSAEAMRISSNGQVLLTAAHPSIQFTDSSDNSDAYIQADGGTLRFFADDNNEVGSSFQSFHIDGSEKMRIDSSGRLGIGTNSPVSFGTNNVGLTVNGSAGSHLAWQNNGTNVAYAYNVGNNFLIGSEQAGSATIFTSAGSQRMRIDSSGDVLIGQTSQTGYAFAQKLVVGDGDNNDGITIQSGSTHQGNLAFNHSDGTTAHGRISYQHGTNYMQFFTNNTERMRITSAGSVGIGTTSPQTSTKGLHVVHDATEGTPSFPDGEVIIAQRNFNSSQGCHIGIIAGSAGESAINFGDKDNSDVGNITYNHSANRMEFATNAAERMRIDSSGNLLVGATGNTPSGGNAKQYNLATGTTVGLAVSVNNTGYSLVNLFYNNTTLVGAISTNGSTTTYGTSSDARLKDVTGEARGLEVINQLNPVAYNWKESGQADEGLIAQEVLDIVPNAVSGSEEEMYSMDYSKLVVHLVAGMKEQQSIIESLTARIETLEG